MTDEHATWTGWSWTCPCGWGTGRHGALDLVKRMQTGHQNWHRAQRAAAETERTA